MKRRAFIAALGSAAAWPVVAGAQQGEPTRRIGVLIPYAEGDAEGRAVIAALQRGLQDFGWAEGRNIRFDIRWAAGDADKARAFAKELIAMAPDVIVPSSNLVTTIMVEETRTIPIVFIFVGDPVGSGYVANMARPGGNVTGFAVLENAIAGKWAETLHEIAKSAALDLSCIRRHPPMSGCCTQPRQRHRQGSRSFHSACTTPARSSRPLPPSQRSPTVV